MIVRAKVVVTMDSAPIDDGAVVISDGRIVAVGKFPELSKKYPGEEKLDLGENALLPGLINAHCHLDYTSLRGKIPRPKSFTDWIRSINTQKANLSPDDYVRSISEGFAKAKQFGTTTIANLTAFPELVSRVEAPIRTWWFVELIDVRQPLSAENLNALCIQVSKATGHWGLAPHAPFTASADLYRQSEEIARRDGVLLTTHLAESREEMSMIRDAEGPLFEFLKGIGRDMSDCGNGTPVALFIKRAVEGNRPYLLVHLNALDNGDFDLLKRLPDEFSVVHCPRSHKYFGHSAFQFQKLRELGLNVCLGTDSLASNQDLSLFAEMRVFRDEFPNVPPEDIFKMVTVNAAKALHQENGLGKIRPGFFADLIAVPIETSTSIFEDIIAFDGPLDWSMVGGRLLP